MLKPSNTNEGVERELIPVGTHQAVVYNVFYLGMQKVEYKGQIKYQEKIYIALELPYLQYTKGKYLGSNMTKYLKYTLSFFDKSNLMKVLPTLLGRPMTDEEKTNGFDEKQLIGKNCFITVIHSQSQSGNTYADVSGITGLPKGIEVIKPTIGIDYIPEFVKELQAQASQNVAKEKEVDPRLIAIQKIIGKDAIEDASFSSMLSGYGAWDWNELTETQKEAIFKAFVR